MYCCSDTCFIGFMCRLIARRFAQAFLCGLFILFVLPLLFNNGRDHNEHFDTKSKNVNKHAKWYDDILVRTIQDALPHTASDSASLEIEQTLSKRKNVKPLVIIGVPTVKRKNKSYLETTLKSLFANIEEEESEDVLVIVMISEPNDLAYVNNRTDSIRKLFPTQIDQGMLHIIAPPNSFYPNFTNLKSTFGDNLERVHWRSKQNLDYAYLMIYAWKMESTYYVQVEDDIITKPKFVNIMKQVAGNYSSTHPNWFVIRFCKLGFIGKFFKTRDLITLAQFLLMFYKDKPVDWLLHEIITTKAACYPGQNMETCRHERNKIDIQPGRSLFQHKGLISSLEGKTQRLVEPVEPKFVYASFLSTGKN